MSFSTEVARVLMEQDLEGFIGMGAPSDEYNHEASEVVNLLVDGYKIYHGERQIPMTDWDHIGKLHILCVLFYVFTSRCGASKKEDSDKLEHYDKAAEEIYKVVQQYKRKPS